MSVNLVGLFIPRASKQASAVGDTDGIPGYEDSLCTLHGLDFCVMTKIYVSRRVRARALETKHTLVFACAILCLNELQLPYFVHRDVSVLV